MIRNKVKQRIKFSMVMVLIAVAISIAIFMVLKYEVEGEKEVPYGVKKIIVISSAHVMDVDKNKETEEQTVQEENPEETAQSGEAAQSAEVQQGNEVSAEPQPNEQVQAEPENNGNVNVEETYVWEKEVVQTNDICIVLDKNENYKEEQIIKSVKIENIQILQKAQIGKIQVYMPNSLDDGMYKYTDDFLVNSTLTYTGATADDKKNLQIRNQGGCVYINFSNVGLDIYKSNEDQEIQQGAFILEKMNVTNEDLKFKVSFDLVIEVQDKSYKTNIVLDLPVDGVVGQKETHTEYTDFSDLIFKREV